MQNTYTMPEILLDFASIQDELFDIAMTETQIDTLLAITGSKIIGQDRFATHYKTANGDKLIYVGTPGGVSEMARVQARRCNMSPRTPPEPTNPQWSNRYPKLKG